MQNSCLFWIRLCKKKTCLKQQGHACPDKTYILGMFKCCYIKWSMRLATPSQFADMPLNLKETNIMGLKIPTGGRQTSWLFTSMTEELNQGQPRNNSSLVVRVELEPATSTFQIRRPYHSATLPPQIIVREDKNTLFTVVACIL